MTTQEDLAAVQKQLEDHESRLRQLEDLLRQPKPTLPKRMSLKEFILSKKPKSDIQKTLAIGYYLEKYQGVESFNIEDIRNGFRTAAEALPANLSDAIRKNVMKGHMMETGQKKNGSTAWMLTSSGEKFVDSNFVSEPGSD